MRQGRDCCLFPSSYSPVSRIPQRKKAIFSKLNLWNFLPSVLLAPPRIRHSSGWQKPQSKMCWESLSFSSVRFSILCALFFPSSKLEGNSNILNSDIFFFPQFIFYQFPQRTLPISARPRARNKSAEFKSPGNDARARTVVFESVRACVCVRAKNLHNFLFFHGILDFCVFLHLAKQMRIFCSLSFFYVLDRSEEKKIKAPSEGKEKKWSPNSFTNIIY